MKLELARCQVVEELFALRGTGPRNTVDQGPGLVERTGE